MKSSARAAPAAWVRYRARDTRIDRTVAIKVLAAKATRDLEAEGRFEREARALATLNHPRICTLFEFTHLDGQALLIMEHLEGQSLTERLARGRFAVGATDSSGCRREPAVEDSRPFTISGDLAKALAGAERGTNGSLRSAAP